jgi:hypothetical protein
VIWFAVPNGGRRTKIEAARMKFMGVKPGVADLVFAWGDSLFSYVLFVELKSDKGRQSAHQKAFQEKCEENYFTYRICRSLDEFSSILKEYNVPRRVKR